MNKDKCKCCDEETEIYGQGLCYWCYQDIYDRDKEVKK
jgi:hypothetical protein